ncbi:hypothetical protein [Yinghuangia sp. YIM S09857]|uniref:hypothetical protein n=1 Tax=Yinghuangia sp. YIM S09857 TaxID=3436929 RepID=UPI003F539BB0
MAITIDPRTETGAPEPGDRAEPAAEPGTGAAGGAAGGRHGSAGGAGESRAALWRRRLPSIAALCLVFVVAWVLDPPCC